VVPARRHRYDRNSYGNCGGVDLEMVHLTPGHLALGNGVITNMLNQARFVVSTHVRYRNKSGKHMLVASFSYFDRCRRKRVCVTDSTMIPTD
jgi:hypothetical protein